MRIFNKIISREKQYHKTSFKRKGRKTKLSIIGSMLKSSLFLFLLFNLPVNLFGISCIYSEFPLELSLNEYNFDSFQMQIDSFPSYDYKDDNNEMCRIEIYVDYKSNLLIISFGDSFQWSQIDNGETRLDFLILFNSNSTDDQEIYNVLEYACYDYYQCEKRFLQNNIHWITQINYTLFTTHLTNNIFNNSLQTGSPFNIY
jgi:hypothetical protein